MSGNEFVVTQEMIDAYIPQVQPQRDALNAMPVCTYGADSPIREMKTVVFEETGLSTEVNMYFPEGEGPYPIVFILGGGGFTTHNPMMYDFQARYLCHDMNCIVAVPNYVLSPEYKWPVANEECYTVIKTIVENAADYNIDTDKIVIAGGSSGGNMAAEMCILSAERKDFKVAQLIIFFGKLDLVGDGQKYATEFTDPSFTSPEFVAFTCLNFAMYTESDNLNNPLVSPMYADVKGFPPTLIVAGGKDIMCGENIVFANKLLEAGVEVTLKIYPEETHGFAYFPTTSETVLKNLRDLTETEMTAVFNK